MGGVLLKETDFFPLARSFSSLTSMFDRQVNSLSAIKVTDQVDLRSG